MKNAVIAGYVRTPFSVGGKGELTKVRADDMAAEVVKGLIERIKVNVDDIEDLILGCAFPEGEQGLNLGRLVVLNADLPITIGGVTVNRFCGSSMQAIHQAVGAIACGAGEVFICAGVESMSRVPMGGFNPLPNPKLYERLPGAYIGMGDTAENVAERWKISRKEQEQLAVDSHAKAAKAQAEGRLADEIIPLQTKAGMVDKDSCIRPGTNLEALANLKPAFDVNGTVTAGTSSPITDGAAAVLVCSEDYAKKHGLPMLARIKSFAVAGCDPDIMGIGPVAAAKKALERADLTAQDMDIIELNEAFASQAIACVKELGLDWNKVNIDGGALALGHPLGATGARITGKAAALLQREKKKYALSAQCIGGGQGIATILEAI
ncbi:thiolase family protein [Candidatus Odyssella acanthamoebae]|uniref:Acetyl-CoA acetyltransferase n=1 Tax=Candidatus Odyssella acanthamoebae TaxID=91604 RepID=A0A077AU74_9PROT|nr:thiolase family protein [Candidatus Paracaedibacter acanthamoebae]AIK95564.1 acetyl-CoA acetyltransferase [Candidatus Paracaedibacter acanthamoebae]